MPHCWNTSDSQHSQHGKLLEKLGVKCSVQPEDVLTTIGCNSMRVFIWQLTRERFRVSTTESRRPSDQHTTRERHSNKLLVNNHRQEQANGEVGGALLRPVWHGEYDLSRHAGSCGVVTCHGRARRDAKSQEKKAPWLDGIPTEVKNTKGPLLEYLHVLLC